MNGLYEIVSSSGDGLFEVRLNSGHAVFRGHFPGNPILPGVCSLMIIRDCASHMTGLRLGYASVRESKFLSAITPDITLTVKLSLSEGEGSHILDATICNSGTIMLKLKARLKTNG